MFLLLVYVTHNRKRYISLSVRAMGTNLDGRIDKKHQISLD